jgi:signal transduction histidine kinase
MKRRPVRSWLLEGSLAALATVLGIFFLRESVSDGDGAPIPVEAVAGALSLAGLILFRRSRPVALALALIPLGAFLGMPMGATPVALFAVALHRPVRVAVALAGLHAVVVAVVYGLALGLTRTYYESVVFLVLVHVSVMAVGMLIRSHRRLVASWAERARQAEEKQQLRIERAQLAERERIAREMHDVLAHRISLLAVHAGALGVRPGMPEAERRAADVIRECAHDALEDLRAVIGTLRTPSEDRPQPTLNDLPSLVEESRAAGAQVALSLRGDEEVPERVGRNTYRIVQEALTNARKHAPGSAVTVDVNWCAARGMVIKIDNELLGAGTGRGRPPPGDSLSPRNRRDEGAPADRLPALALAGARWSEPAADGDDAAGALSGAPNGNLSGPATAGEVAGAARSSSRAAASGIARGAGLVGLRERVDLAGGSLEHGPTANGHFQLKAWLPWQR